MFAHFDQDYSESFAELGLRLSSWLSEPDVLPRTWPVGMVLTSERLDDLSLRLVSGSVEDWNEQQQRDLVFEVVATDRFGYRFAPPANALELSVFAPREFGFDVERDLIGGGRQLDFSSTGVSRRTLRLTRLSNTKSSIRLTVTPTDNGLYRNKGFDASAALLLAIPLVAIARFELVFEVEQQPAEVGGGARFRISLFALNSDGQRFNILPEQVTGIGIRATLMRDNNEQYQLNTGLNSVAMGFYSMEFMDTPSADTRLLSAELTGTSLPYDVLGGDFRLIAFIDAPPRLLKLGITAAEPTKAHPAILGEETVFVITLSPEYTLGVGPPMATLDLQLSGGKATFLSGGGVMPAEGDSSRASITLDGTTSQIRVSVRPDPRLETTVTLTAVDRRNMARYGPFVLSVEPAQIMPAELVLEWRDAQGQKAAGVVVLDAAGGARGRLFIRLLDATGAGIVTAAGAVGALELALGGHSGALMQIRVSDGDSGQLPALAASGIEVAVELSAPPNLLTTVTVVVRNYAHLPGSRLQLRLESAQPNRLASGARLSIGPDFLCWLNENGNVRCGGATGVNGGTEDSRSGSRSGEYEYQAFDVLTAKPVEPLSGVVALGQSVSSPPVSCALLIDGEVACWGQSGSFGGINLDHSARRLPGLKNVLQLSLGADFGCALVGDEGGTGIWCWGDNRYGQAGEDPRQMPTIAEPRPASSLASLRGVIQLDAGADHACALRADGRVFCWGRNGSVNEDVNEGAAGLLGGDASLVRSTTPVEVAVGDVIQIAAGEQFSCALARPEGEEEDDILCWGGGYSGDDAQLQGLVSRVSSIIGFRAVPGVRLQQLTVAGPQGCALTDSGVQWCWRDSEVATSGDSWIYGNDSNDTGGERTAYCFDESGQVQSCLSGDIVLRCLQQGSSLADVQSGRCQLLPADVDPGMLEIIATAADRLLLYTALFYEGFTLPRLICDRTNESCVSERISWLTTILNSGPRTAFRSGLVSYLLVEYRDRRQLVVSDRSIARQIVGTGDARYYQRSADAVAVGVAPLTGVQELRLFGTRTIDGETGGCALHRSRTLWCWGSGGQQLWALGVLADSTTETQLTADDDRLTGVYGQIGFRYATSMVPWYRIDESPRLRELAITTDNPIKAFGVPVVFVITLSPEYTPGVGPPMATIDLQLSGANAVFLSGGGVMPDEGNGRRASIILDGTTSQIRISVRPSNQDLDTLATLTATDRRNRQAFSPFFVRVDASSPEVCQLLDGTPSEAQALNIVTRDWKGFDLLIGSSAEVLSNSLPYGGIASDVDVLMLAARVMPYGSDIRRVVDRTAAASFVNNRTYGFSIITNRVQIEGKELAPFFRYQAEFRNARGEVFHRAVQCRVVADEIEGFGDDARDFPGNAGLFMCDWTAGKPESGQQAPLSPYFEQRPSSNKFEQAQPALRINSDDIVIVNGNSGFSVLEAVDFTVALKPGVAAGAEPLRSVEFSLTDWAGTIVLDHCSTRLANGPYPLPIDGPPTNAKPPAYYGVTAAALIFPEPPPRLTTLNITTDEPLREHPVALGGEVVFMITLSPEYSAGDGPATAVVDLQLSTANAVFLPGGDLILSEQDSSRASIRLSTRTVQIRVSVTPDPRVDTTVTLTAVANEDRSSLGSLALTVRASANLPVALRMELQDEQGQRIDTLVLDAGGGARGRLFVEIEAASGDSLAVARVGSLILELDGLTGPLIQVRLLSEGPDRLPSQSADDSVFDVAFSLPPNLFTTVTLVAENYAYLPGARLPLRFERAAATRPVSGNRLSLGTEYLCGLTENGTVRCGGQAGLNGHGTKDSRTGFVPGSYKYEVFEVLDAASESTLSGVVALEQSVSLPPVSCALLRDGDVACWGESGTSFGGIDEINHKAQRLPDLHNVLQLSLGRNFGCALVAGDGGGTEIHCWGVNSHGQAGSGSAPSTIASPRLASNLSSLRGVIQLAAGGTHACALQLDGRVFCWGESGQTQRLLGRGGLLSQSTEPVEVAVSNAVQIAAGREFSCALSRSVPGEKDSVWCWGGKYSGTDDRLFDGLLARVSPIAGIASPPGASLRQLAIAGRQGCALVDTGKLWCWRENATVAAGNSWIYGNDFGDAGGRQALCFSESGATVSCLGRDTVLECLKAGQLLDDVRSGQCELLPEPRSSGNLLALVADAVDRLLLYSAVFFDSTTLKIEPCGRTDQSCISQRIMRLTEALNSPSDDALRVGLLRFYQTSENHRRRAAVPQYTIAWQLARAEDSLYYQRSTSALTVGVAPLTAVLEMRLFANGGCALRRDSSLWCWGASSLGSNSLSEGHGFWTSGVSSAGETEVQFVLPRLDQIGYRYAASIVPWDRADAVRVWTEIRVELFANRTPPLVRLDPPVLVLPSSENDPRYISSLWLRVSLLAGPPDEFGKLRPIAVPDNQIAPIEFDPLLPADVTVTPGEFLSRPFQIAAAMGTQLSTLSVAFVGDNPRASAVIGIRIAPAVAEPDVVGKTQYLSVVLEEKRLANLSLRLVSGSTEHWSVTRDRYFTFEIVATDPFGYLFDPPEGALELSASRLPNMIGFDAEQDVIGGRLLDFSAGVSSRTLRFKRLANFEGPIRVIVAPASGSLYEDSSATRTFFDIEVPQLDVSRFLLQFEVLEQQPDIDAPARYRVFVDTLDVNGLAVAAPPEQTMGLGLRIILVDTAGNQYPFAVDNLLFQDSYAQLDFTVNLQGDDARLFSAELTGTSLPYDIATAQFGLIAVEVLDSLTVTGPSSPPTQTVPAEAVRFTVTITGVGSKGTPFWRSREALRLTYTAAPGVRVVYASTLTFSAGVATVTVSVTPVPGVDAPVTFRVAGNSADLAGVSTNMITVDVGAVEVLGLVTLTVQNGLMRTVRSGQELITIDVQLVTEYFGKNEPAQTALQLRAVATNGVESSVPVDVVVPAGGAATAELMLMLGTTARQTIVSFEVVGLPSGSSLISPEVRVELVPEAASLTVTAMPQALLDLEPRRVAVAEFRVRVDVQGSDGRLFDGPIDLVLAAAVTAVEDGDAGDIRLSFEQLAGTAAVGVYESTVRVTIVAGQVSAASVEFTVEGTGLASVPVTVQLARPLILDRLELSLVDNELRQAEAGAAVQAMAMVLAYDQFDGSFRPADLRLRVVDIAAETEVLLTTPALVFDAQGQAQSELELTPPRGINQDLRVELVGVTDAEVDTSTAVLSLIAVELLGSLMVTGPALPQPQSGPGEEVLFELTVTAVGTKDTPFQPTEILQLTYTAALGVRVDYVSVLSFSAAGVATVMVRVTPVPGTDASVIFGVTGDPDDLAGVSTNMITVDVGAAEVLNTVTLTVQNGLVRTVRSGPELIAIEVRLVTEYLGENQPEQTVLRLQALATNGVVPSAVVEVIVPTGESTTTALILALGTTARQSTVSFAVEGLQAETSFISPEVRVELVPEAVSLEISALPKARLDLEPRRVAVAEFRVRVDVQGSDDLPFGGPIDLVLGATVTAVTDADGEKGDLLFSPSSLFEETAVGVYESTLTVTLTADQVSMASVKITVTAAGLISVSTTVQLARPLILDRLELSLAATELPQAEAGAAVQTMAMVLAYDQFDGAVSPAGLRLRVVDTGDGSVVLVTTPELVFDARGEAQLVLTLTPPRGVDQDLRVELVGVTDPEVSTNAVNLELIAVELLGSLMVTGPTAPQLQAMPAGAVRFELTVTAVGTKNTPFQPTGLALEHAADADVVVDYESALMFSAGVATVMVMVTPVPGVDAPVTFGVTGDADALAGVSTNMITVDVVAAEVLNTVTLTVSGDLRRTVRSGQEEILITVQLMTEYLGENQPQQTTLQLQAVGTNDVVPSAVVEVIVPTGESATTELILTLGTTARQTTVSFVVVEGLQAETSFISPEVRVELVPEAVSLTVSAMPRLIEELEPREAVTAEFGVRVDVQGSDGALFAGPIDLVLAAAVTVVEDGDVDDIELSFGSLTETEVGVYESTVMVTIATDQVSMARVELTVTGASLAGVSTTVQLVRPRILDSLELSLADSEPEQAEAGAAVLATAMVLAYDQFGGSFSPAGLRLRVVDTADETEVLLTTPPLVFDTQGEAQSVLTLTPPRGINQDLRVELVGVTDVEVSTNAATLELIAVELLGSLTVTGPTVLPPQTGPGEEVLFDVRVVAVGTQGTQPWEPTEMLRLTSTAAPGVIVDYISALSFSAAGIATVMVRVTPVPGVNAPVSFGVTGDPDDLVGVSTNMITVDVVAAEVLNTVTLTVQNGLMRTVRSGQEVITIEVQLVTEYLGENPPEQTTLQLRAVGTNSVVPSAVVEVIVPTGESTTTVLILTLGDARQSTVNFVVEGLQAETSLFSPEVRVDLVPEAVSLAVSATPQRIDDLEPRGAAVAEFRVRVDVQGSDALPFGGPIDLVRGTAVAAVEDGNASHLDLSFGPLARTAAVGGYESTLTVTLTADQVSSASVQITVDAAGLAGVSTLVQLARPLILDRLELSLADRLEQADAGAAVLATATVTAYDQFDGSFSPIGLRLRVVDVGEGTEVLMTPVLVFDAQGKAQSVLELTPPRGMDQDLRVELVGVTDAEVRTSTAALSLIAEEVLGSLTVTGPTVLLPQTGPGEEVLFDVRVVAVGTQGTQQWQPTETLELSYTAARGVMVDYVSVLRFIDGVATVTVSVTPVPGTDAAVVFGVTGDPDDLIGVSTNMITVDVVAAEVLNTVTLTVQNGLMRTVRSGQEEIPITVRLVTEYLGDNKPEQTALRLQAVGTNGVVPSAVVEVVVPTGESTTTVLILMLGTTARQTTVSFVVVEGRQTETRFISPEVRVELVPVAVSLALSATPRLIEELEPRGVAVAEFRVRVDVQGSDALPFDGPIDLVRGTVVAAVEDGDASHLDLSFEPLTGTAAVGVYESTLTVTLTADQVSSASVKITVTSAGLSSVSTTVQLARPLILDRLELSLADGELRQAEAGAAVLAMATVTALDQFARPFSPIGLRLRVVDTGDGSVVLVTTPALVFDAQGEAQLVLTLTPPRGINQDLRVELVGVTDPEVRTSTAALSLIAEEVLGSLTVTGPTVLPPQTGPGEEVLFDVRVVAVGTQGTQQWQPTEMLRLTYTAASGVIVDYDSTLMFSAGVATVTVSVTPSPGTNALVTFRIAGDPSDLAGVSTNMVTVVVGAAEVLNTVTLTVQNGLMRTVRSGQEEILITVQLMTEYLGDNQPQQTALQLRAVATNNVAASAVVDVIVPTDESTTTDLILTLGTARQTTVSFEVVGLPSGASLFSPELRVELVPVAISLALSATPRLIEELEPRRMAVAEFRVRVDVQGSDALPFDGPIDLVRGTVVAAVEDGDASHLDLSLGPLTGTAAVGVYESTLTVTLTADQVSSASVQITVEAAGLAGVSTLVQLARPLILDRLELSLMDSELRQADAGAPVLAMATVTALDQFARPFSPIGLRLRVVDTGDGSVVLVTTPALVFDARGEAQSVLVLTPPRGINQDLRVALVGVTDPEVSRNTVDIELIAVELLGSLTVVGPSSPLTQTMPAEAVRFELTVTAEGTKGKQPWQPTESLELAYTAASGVSVIYDSALMFSAAGVATVTVSVTPSPGTNALVTFRIVGDPADLDGVMTNMVTVNVGVVEVLNTVTLTVQGERMRTVRSGQEEIAIEVRLMAEYLGETEPEQTLLRLRAVGTNGVDASEPADVIVPAGGSTTTVLILTLGTTARQTTVSFEVVGLPSGASLFSPELRVELVPVAVSLALSATPQAMLELEPRGEVTAEFRVSVNVWGSDGELFDGPIDLVFDATLTAVADGSKGDLVLSSSPLAESAAGVYESTLTVTITADRVSMASVEITVGSAGLSSVPVTVQLARPLILDSLTLALFDDVLEQSPPGSSVQTTATVMAYDQFGDAFSPAGLRLRLVDIADGSEVLVTTPELVFDAQGQAQSVLTLTPPRGRDQNLRVELVGVTDAEVSSNTVALELMAEELLGSLTVTGPSSTQTQTVRDEAVLFAVRVEAVGTKDTQQWQPTEMLQLTYTAAPGVKVALDSTLRFSAGVATVTVSVTPVPGTDAPVTFGIAGDPADLDGVRIVPAELSVIAVEVLSTVTLTVQNGLMRAVQSGQDLLTIEVQLMTAYLGEKQPQQTVLRLRAVGTNDVMPSAVVAVIVPTGESTTTVLSLVLGDARQSTVSFVVEGLQAETSLISPEVRVELVPVAVSLALSATPRLIEDLEPRGDAVAEFMVRVDVQGSDALPFAGQIDLVLGTTVTAVTDGNAGDLVFSPASLTETTAGVYESTLTVTIAARQVRAASVEIIVEGAGLTSAPALVQLARPLILDRLELSLTDSELLQAEAGAAVQTTAMVLAYDQFGDSFSPAGLRLRVVDTGDESEVLVTTPALVFDARGEAKSLLTLTPPRGRDQDLRVEVAGVTDAEVRTSTAALSLIAVEVLDSLTVTVPVSTLTQTMRDEAVLFELTITAEGTKGSEQFPPTESLELTYTAAPDVMVIYNESPLTFSAAGVATVTVSVTPVPGTDALVTFDVTGASADVVTIPAELAVIAAEVLSTVTLTVQNGLMRTVRSGQEEILITVQLTTEYLGENKPQQTVLQLRAMGTNGVGPSVEVAVIVPTGESTTTELVLMLGTARQSTVSFEVVGLPSGARLISPEVRVELVPVPVSLAISAMPQAMLELEPRGEVTAEFRVSVNVWGSDGELFGGLSGLALDTTVTAVADGNESDLDFSPAPLTESAAGVHESTVRVTITAGQVSAASVEITVEGAGLTSVSVTVQLARPLILDRFQLSLTDSELRQAEAGAAVQTTATVSAYDQFGDFFSPAGLRLRVVDTGDGSVVLVTTPALVFDARGEAQLVLTLTPPRGINQDLRVEVVGVTDAEVGTSTAALSLIAVEVLDSLTVTVPASTLTQTMRDEAVLFELTVTAAGTKDAPLQPDGLALQHVADSADVMVVYDESPLTFSAGVATVTVSVTPVPGTDARVTFDVTGAAADVVTIPAELSVIAAEVLNTVTLTVQGERMRIVRSGQEEILITVQLQTEYLGENIPEQTALRLQAVGTNGVEASAVVEVIVPAGESTTTALILSLGTIARQTTVSFVVVNLPAETSFISQDVRVELVPVPVSLAISVMPAVIVDLERSGEAVAEFRVRVDVQGSDGALFGGLSDLVLDTTVTAVADGEADDIDLSFEQLMETAVGVYESTVRVTIVADRVSAASVKITVEGAGLSSVTTTVQLARRVPLASLMLALADSELRQAEAGAAVQTTATVVALDQDGLPVMPIGLQLSVVATADESVVMAVELVFDEQGQAQSVLKLTPPRGRNQSLRVEVAGVTDPEVKTSTAALSLIAVEVLDSLTVAVPASTLAQTIPAEAVLFELTVTAVGTKDTPLQPAGLTLTYTAAPGVRVAVDSTLTFSAGVATVMVSVTPVPGTDAQVTFSVAGDTDDLDGVITIPAELSVIAAEVLNTVTLTVQNGLMRTVESGREVVTIEVQLMTEYLGENKPAQTVLQLRALGTNGVDVSGPADVVIPTGESTTTVLNLMLGTTARQTTVSFAVVELPSGASFIGQEVRVELVPVPVSLALSAMPQIIEELEPRDAVTAEFLVRVDVQGSDGQPFDGPIDLVLDTTVATVEDGEKGDLVFSSASLAKTAAGVYESTVRVTIAALRVSEASVQVAVEGAGLTDLPVTVQLARRMTMDSLTLALSDDELQQAEAGASVQVTATVTALDQFDRPIRPTALQLRVVDTGDGSVVLLTTPTLVFDAEGQAQSLLMLTPPPGTNQDLRVELVKLTAAEDSLATAELQIEAAEALGRVILTVVGGSEQFVSTNNFSITLELSLERAGDRPLTAATALTAQLRVSIMGGDLDLDEENFDVSATGVSPGSVVITGMVAGNASSATISLSIGAGVPAGIPVAILPANTVKVSLVPDLDVDDNEVFDVRDAVLILNAVTSMAASRPLPDSLPDNVRMGLERVVSPDNPDMRLDVDGNGMVEPIDMRLLLRYSAGLRGGSLMENAADTKAIERRAREIIGPRR